MYHIHYLHALDLNKDGQVCEVTRDFKLYLPYDS